MAEILHFMPLFSGFYTSHAGSARISFINSTWNEDHPRTSSPSTPPLPVLIGEMPLGDPEPASGCQRIRDAWKAEISTKTWHEIEAPGGRQVGKFTKPPWKSRLTIFVYWPFDRNDHWFFIGGLYTTKRLTAGTWSHDALVQMLFRNSVWARILKVKHVNLPGV